MTKVNDLGNTLHKGTGILKSLIQLKLSVQLILDYLSIWSVLLKDIEPLQVQIG